MQNNIILVGLMGAGKSTIGRQLARRLNLTFYDSDKVVEERTGVSIPTIFAVEGEAGFREREEQVIAELTALPNTLIATGGGSVLRESNREHIKAGGTVIYLRASAEQLFQRIRHDKTRPLMQTANPMQTLRDLLKAREPLYMEVADLIMPTGKQKVNVILRDIHAKLKQLQDVTHANAES
ncbi:shikimate kinase [Thiothrix lacustris]|uniref:Shikimate kinase n=1 Tax=Thiothrix lacustris TaxID=525917 RepID=A0ABY9MS59_9GAMM|nr:shikimate kinase [Thiothrix lacustris]WML91452.1 shikimate kinase [Thiothrix lacustris]WMP16695.1 shikimate kinase [Thiothrix lacustris]